MTKEAVEALMRIHGVAHALDPPDRELTTCDVCIGLLGLWLYATDSGAARPDSREAAASWTAET